MRVYIPDEILAGGGIGALLRGIKCKADNRSVSTCINRECNKYAFTCGNPHCVCQEDHQGNKCLSTRTDKISNSVVSKRISMDPIQKIIKNQIDKRQNDLDRFRDKMIQKLRTQFQLYGMSQSQEEFIKIVNNRQFDGLTGKKMFQIAFNSQDKSKYQKDLQKFQNQFVGQMNRLDNEINRRLMTIQKQLNSLKNQHNKNGINQIKQIGQIKQIKQIKQINQLKQIKQFNQIKQIRVINQIKQEIQIQDGIFKESNIKLLRKSQEKIKKYFTQSKIKSVKLLYKATKDGFPAMQFRLKCYGVPSTLVVCQTEFGKVIGGYTPIRWNASKDDFVKSQNRNSFIFSLTNDQKFILDPKLDNKQIYCSSSQGPGFGSQDFYISSKANDNQNSYADIGYTYSHPNYKRNDKQSYERFSGSIQHGYFKVKQWQVWKVQFQNPSFLNKPVQIKQINKIKMDIDSD